jgi:hypothetical protein
VLTQLVKLGFESAQMGVKKMFTLLFSKDQKIKEAVTACYRSMYLDDNLSTLEKVKGILQLIS